MVVLIIGPLFKRRNNLDFTRSYWCLLRVTSQIVAPYLEPRTVYPQSFIHLYEIFSQKNLRRSSFHCSDDERLNWACSK